MREEVHCTAVVLLLGDPAVLGEAVPATLAGLYDLDRRTEVLFVCDGPAWRQCPALQRFLVHGPRAGLLQTRTVVDHPAPLVNLALDWVRTPAFFLARPGVSVRPEALGCLREALDRQATAAAAHTGAAPASHSAVIRTAALRRAGGVDAAPVLQTALDLDLAGRLASVGEVLAVEAEPPAEPRWAWAEYPFLKRWPVPAGVVRRYLDARLARPEPLAA